MKFKFWIGIIISVVCLYFVFRGIEWHKLLDALHSANYVYLIAAAALQLSTIWLRAERWKYLLAPIKQLTFRHLVPATMIGFMANSVLPARAGEFIRAYVIGKKERISKTASFATIVIERVCDMITLLLLLIVVLLFVQFPQGSDAANPGLGTSVLSPALFKQAGSVSAVFVIGLLAFLILLKEFPAKTKLIIQKVFTPLPASLTHKVLDLIESFRLGLQVLKTGKHLLFLTLWSLLVWLVYVFSTWVILRSFGLQLPLLAGIFITVMIAFSAALPSSPGYIGPFHAAVVASILFFLPTFDRSAAAGIAVVFHLTAIIPIVLMGFFYLWKENMTFSEIQHIEEEQDESTIETMNDRAINEIHR